jgi:hypothetical protein
VLEEIGKADASVLAAADARAALLDLLARGQALGSTQGERLFGLVSSGIGPLGPDLLYELCATKSGTDAAKRAEELLKTDKVRAIGSEALRVAYDLRSAEGCPARLKLFEPARLQGDRRALTELQRLKDCDPSAGCCMRDNQPLAEAITLLAARLGPAPTATTSSTSSGAPGAPPLGPGTVPSPPPGTTTAPGARTAAPKPASSWIYDETL